MLFRLTIKLLYVFLWNVYAHLFQTTSVHEKDFKFIQLNLRSRQSNPVMHVPIIEQNTQTGEEILLYGREINLS